MAMGNEQVIEQLNSFLRGEISSVETYRQALTRVKDASALGKIQDVERDHQRRVDLLRQRIVQLGGKPSDGSGLWGAWAKAVQGGAVLLGEKAAIEALETGEDHGLADYRRDLAKLDSDTQQFVQADLLPAQVRTHGTMSALKKTLH